MSSRSVSSARQALASREEIAEYLNVPVSTLAYWATHRAGPPFRKVGRLVRYSWAECEAWIAEQEAGGGA
jgi:excisionase family DNA binding protein